VSAVAGADAAAKVRTPAIDAFIAGFHASSLVAAVLAAAGAVFVALALRRGRAADVAAPVHGPNAMELPVPPPSTETSSLAGASR
ncbi:MAG: hypothetical protein ACK5WX_15660, partial [bacterium]